MNIDEIEERFIALESLAAEYERTLKDLNQIVAQQALTIDRLQREVFFLAQNFDSSGQVRPLSEEVPPPHY
ncbi:MAG: SlyX family protein [Alphaproteobacteria bacterium]|nr:SlyX family protein [Alphaproteobacteria bacterium]